FSDLSYCISRYIRLLFLPSTAHEFGNIACLAYYVRLVIFVFIRNAIYTGYLKYLFLSFSDVIMNEIGLRRAIVLGALQ
ncbi:MAG: hypothetical protein ACRCUL_05180, partial [Plesiomonas sp.]